MCAFDGKRRPFDDQEHEEGQSGNRLLGIEAFREVESRCEGEEDQGQLPRAMTATNESNRHDDQQHAELEDDHVRRPCCLDWNQAVQQCHSICKVGGQGRDDRGEPDEGDADGEQLDDQIAGTYGGHAPSIAHA